MDLNLGNDSSSSAAAARLAATHRAEQQRQQRWNICLAVSLCFTLSNFSLFYLLLHLFPLMSLTLLSFLSLLAIYSVDSLPLSLSLIVFQLCDMIEITETVLLKKWKWNVHDLFNRLLSAAQSVIPKPSRFLLWVHSYASVGWQEISYLQDHSAKVIEKHKTWMEGLENMQQHKTNKQ